MLQQIEGPHLLAQDFGVEERFGLDSHLPEERIGVGGEKPSGFGEGKTSNIQHPTEGIGGGTLNLEP